MLFHNIVGQTHAKTVLNALFNRKHFPPLLFVGPKGTGKRTTAINFAQIINCQRENDIATNQCQRCSQIGNLAHPDIKLLFPILTGFTSDTDESKILQEIGNNINSYALGQTKPDFPATNLIPIRMVRWIKKEMAYKPIVGKHKIIIILNIDKMNHEAANAFLKTLEEPQRDTLFIMTTERISSILPTIRSRCQTVRFTTIDSNLITEYLMQNKDVSKEEAKLAATIAEGSIRKALDFLYNKDTFLPSPDLLKLFYSTQTLPLESLNLMFGNNYETINPGTIISEILFIYRNALKSKLSIPLSYENDVITKITASLSTEQIVRQISFLLNMLQDTEIHLNKKLFLFSILSAVKF